MSLHFKFVTAGQSPDDAQIVTQVIRGESLRPVAPSDLSAVKDGSGDWLISAIGRPLEREIPESYIVRLRRVTGDVALRDVPVVPSMNLAAMLIDAGIGEDAGHVSIDRNTVVGTVPIGFVYGSARTIQQLGHSGTEITARIVVSGDVLLNFGEASWRILFGYLSETESRIGITNWSEVEVISSDNIPTVDGVIYTRITIVGTEVRFYYSGSPITDAMPPNAVLADEPIYPSPAYLYITLGNGGAAYNVRLGGSRRVQTIYSLAQQEADNSGSGIAEGDLDVEIWQVSPYENLGIVGRSVRSTF